MFVVRRVSMLVTFRGQKVNGSIPIACGDNEYVMHMLVIKNLLRFCVQIFLCDMFFLDQVPAKARESTPPPAIPERPDLASVTIRPGIAAELLELLRMK